ncbi:hypothetical protein [Micromonospora sp. NPDC023644]|uniref:hypothetical protein n=1 Tax=Micromonospora sp. NPDC023644 TaxID=3154321 RepID=UPI0033D36DBA
MHHQSGGSPPVFVDRTGRRRRLTVIAGTAMGLGLLTSLGLIAAGLFMDTSVPLPGWSDDRRAPLEAGIDGRDGAGRPAPTGVRPSTVTSTSAPTPTATRSAGSRYGSVPATTGPARPDQSDRPGQGDERRGAKPSRSPGKPS